MAIDPGISRSIDGSQKPVDTSLSGRYRTRVYLYSYVVSSELVDEFQFSIM